MSGLILQERSVGEGYYVGSAGRAFLRLCTQLYKLANEKLPLAEESIEILKTLGAELFDLSQFEEYFGNVSISMQMMNETQTAG